MYQAFYDLRLAPFDAAADLSFLVETVARRGALDAIADQVRRGTAVITLEGWNGVGKTELLGAYERNIDPDRVRICRIARPDFDSAQLRALLGEMLAGPFAPPPSLAELQRLLTDRAAQGQSTVLLVDDTENLTDGALRALGTVSDLAAEAAVPVSILLVVRPPYVALFARPAAAALDRRASVRVRLPPLTPVEARSVIEHRLRQAGAADPHRILSPEAIEAIVVEAGGIPRRLLSLGDRVLQAGASRRQAPIDYAVAEAAIRGGNAAASVPARTRLPISIDPGGQPAWPSGGRRGSVDGAARLAVPLMLLMVAVGVGYWLWSLSDEMAPPPPVQAAAGPQIPPPAPPAPSPPPPSPPPAAAPAPSVASPVPAPVDLLFIPARRGDTLRTLYRNAYRAPRYRPSFDALLAANPDLTADRPLAAGQLVALPGPLINR